MSSDEEIVVCAAAAELGIAAGEVRAIAGDASRRNFYRVAVPAGTLVAAVYPDDAGAQLERDEAVHAWGWSRGLPIPRPAGHTARVAFAEDLGDEDLERALRTRGEGVLDGAIEALAAFQRCEWHDTPTPRFDAAFFRRELAIFEQLAVPAGSAAGRAAGAFLDDLASRVAAHPYRLVHRDFHVNNLFLRGADVAAVDYQDMRGGPDTYDVASLLRERGCAELLSSDDSWRARAARRLAWSGAWERRYLECAAQRGIKVVGTFLRLAAGGRPEYLAWLPRVRELARRAVVEIDGPGAMVELLSE